MRPCAATLASELADPELECLSKVISDHKLQGPHLEIGTAAGGTLQHMMRCYDAETRPSFVVVDPMTYFPSQFNKIKENLTSYGLSSEEVDFRVKTSVEAFKESFSKGETFDLIFIDGNHKCRYVLKDLEWSKLLRENGLLILHDYNSRTPGVIWATRRFLKHNPQYKEKTLVNSLLVIQKNVSSRSTKISWADHVFAEVLTFYIQCKQSLKKRFQKRKLSAY